MVNSPETINPIFDQDPGRLEVTAVREGSLKERASRYVHGSGDGDEARHHLASSPTSFHHTDQLSNGHLSPRPGKEGQAIVNGHSSTSSNEADGQLGQVERPALDRLPRSSQTAGYAAPNSRLAPANGDEGVRQVAAEAPIPLYDSGESLRLAPSPASLSTSLPASTPSSSSPNGYLQPPSPAKRAVPPGSMRRSLTSGASPSPSTSRSPNRGRVVQRTMSQGPLAISPVEATSDELAVSPVSDDSEAAFRDSLARQADEIRRERAERRKQVAEPQRAPSTSRIVAKGNPISDGHQSWLLMYNMLTGIRVAVSRCEAKAKRPLTKADYRATTKFSFDTLGNELTPSVKHDFKFKDYAPWVFRDLREHFCVDPADYLVSLTAKYILSELGSPGKSGSFFYYSSDFRYIIKTVSRNEHRFLRGILQSYHAHVQANPHTLISRFYGLHRVKMPKGKKIAFLVMNNLFPPHRDVHETYDLKGSSQGREYPEDKAKDNPGAVLKDLNWVRRGRQFELGPEKKAFLEEQLRRDVEMLSREKIMDYSLLVGVHELARGNKDNLREQTLTMFKPDTTGKLRRRPTQVQRETDASAFRQALERADPQALNSAAHLPDKDRSEKRHFIFYQDEGGMRATNELNEPGNQLYYFGIIDILTPYTLYKRVEHAAKSFKYDGDTISAIPPDQYGKRFLNFLFSSIRGGDLTLRPKME